MGAISSLFGYLLNALYSVFNNYGIAIIVFSIILRIILIPITIKQQKSLKKSAVIKSPLLGVEGILVGGSIASIAQTACRTILADIGSPE